MPEPKMPTSSVDSEKKLNFDKKKARDIAGGVILGAAAIAGGHAKDAEGVQTPANPLDNPNETQLSVDQNPNSPEAIVAEGKRRAAQREAAIEKRDMQSDAKWERLRDLAKQMDVYEANIENGEIVEKLKRQLVGGVPVEINGKQVPEELYTADELRSLNSARKYSQTMNDLNAPGYEMNESTYSVEESEKESQSKNKSNKNRPIESAPYDGSIL